MEHEDRESQNGKEKWTFYFRGIVEFNSARFDFLLVTMIWLDRQRTYWYPSPR